MNRTREILTVASIAFAACAFQVPALLNAEDRASLSSSVLWTDRGDISSLDLLYGSGGKEHQPAGKFTFVEEDKEGTSAKFEIVDEQGIRWKAKLGEETKSETAAAHLLWAIVGEKTFCS